MASTLQQNDQATSATLSLAIIIHPMPLLKSATLQRCSCSQTERLCSFLVCFGAREALLVPPAGGRGLIGSAAIMPTIAFNPHIQPVPLSAITTAAVIDPPLCRSTRVGTRETHNNITVKMTGSRSNPARNPVKRDCCPCLGEKAISTMPETATMGATHQRCCHRRRRWRLQHDH